MELNVLDDITKKVDVAFEEIEANGETYILKITKFSKSGDTYSSALSLKETIKVRDFLSKVIAKEGGK